MKKAEKLLNNVDILAAPLIIASFLLVLFCAKDIQRTITIRAISKLIIANSECAEIDNPCKDQWYVYSDGGFFVPYMEYGYYYSTDDKYLVYHSGWFELDPENRYRNGYRYDEEYDWYYTEKITDHWYYYEFDKG